jgi:hypothetical protein
MAKSVINSYLVSLGFEINQTQMTQFLGALRTMGLEVEKYTTAPLSGIAPMFVKAGAAIAGTLASITAGTLGLLEHVSSADLDFQILARRMYMSTDAAKAMKIATDALGYSLEDVIWGPKELRERYMTLIEDQRKMQSGLGPDFEHQMRQIRDITFQFTRLKVEAQYFVMGLVKDISKGLFGDEGGLLRKFQEFNAWFQEHMPEIEQWMADKLVPVLKDTAAIFRDFWDIAKQINVKPLVDDLVRLVHTLREVVDYIAQHPDVQKLLGWTAGGAAIGGAVGGPLGAVMGGAVGGLTGMAKNITDPAWKQFSGDWTQAANQGQFKLWAMQAAAKYKLDPFELMGLFSTESGTKWGWNPNDRNPTSGAMGFGQFMPETAKQYGLTNPYDPQSNIFTTAQFLSDLIKQYGSLDAALKHYGGWVTKDPSNYINDIHRRANEFRTGGGRFQPSAMHSSVDYGGVTINIHSNQDPKQIASEVRSQLEAHEKTKQQRNMAQMTGVYA